MPLELAVDGIEIYRQHSKALRSFCVIGERSTGTNIAKNLMEANTDLPHLRMTQWKHGFPDAHFYPRGHLIIVTFRRADDWAISMFAKPWEATRDVLARDFHHFLRERWTSAYSKSYGVSSHDIHGFDDRRGARLLSDADPITALPFENIFKMRSMKNRAFLHMHNRVHDVVYVSLEHLRDNKRLFLERLSSAFDIPLKESFSPITKKHGENRFWKHRRARAPEALDAADLAFMKSQLDLELEARLGYHY